MEIINPNRLTDTWDIATEDEIIQQLVDLDIPLAVTPTREVRLGRIGTASDYPMRQLYDENVKLIIGSGLPSIYHTALTDEYQLVVEDIGLSIEDLEDIALNSLRYSFLPEDEKQTMLAEFQEPISNCVRNTLPKQSQSSNLHRISLKIFKSLNKRLFLFNRGYGDISINTIVDWYVIMSDFSSIFALASPALTASGNCRERVKFPKRLSCKIYSASAGAASGEVATVTIRMLFSMLTSILSLTSPSIVSSEQQYCF